MTKNESYRRKYWLVLIWLSIVLFEVHLYSGKIITALTKEQTVISVYAPEHMKKAFKAALTDANLNYDYTIKIVKDKELADVVVDYNKEDDSSYRKFAFSPYMASMAISDKNKTKAMLKAGTLIQNKYDSDIYDIDLMKVIDEALGDGAWENLGLSDNGELLVMYPATESIYWDSFEEFMLANINNGKYPANVSELEKAKKILNQFMNSNYTDSYTNLNEKYERMGGFNDKVLWLLPESSIYELYGEYSDFTCIYGPAATMYFNYYMKGQTEIGIQLVNEVSDSFYAKLKTAGYRNSEYLSLNASYTSIYYERDIYTLIEKTTKEIESVSSDSDN
jgi:hypothetical protein